MAFTDTSPPSVMSAPAPMEAFVTGVNILMAAEPAPASPPEPMAAPRTRLVILIFSISYPTIGTVNSIGLIEVSASTDTLPAAASVAPSPMEAVVVLST